MEFLYYDSFYVYLAFFAVMALLVVKGKNAILGTSYQRIKRISNDIAAAEKLRMEAQQMLAEQEKKFRETVALSESLVQDARDKSDRITEQAQQNAEDIIARAEERAAKTIQRAEVEARVALQNQAVDKAFEIVREMAIEHAGDVSLQTAIADIKKFK